MKLDCGMLSYGPFDTVCNVALTSTVIGFMHQAQPYRRWLSAGPFPAEPTVPDVRLALIYTEPRVLWSLYDASCAPHIQLVDSPVGSERRFHRLMEGSLCVALSP